MGNGSASLANPVRHNGLTQAAGVLDRTTTAPPVVGGDIKTITRLAEMALTANDAVEVELSDMHEEVASDCPIDNNEFAGDRRTSKSSPRKRSSGESGEDRTGNERGRIKKPQAPTALPEGCPVKPLGHRNGTYYYLDGSGQLRELSEREHAQTVLDSLFASNHKWMLDRFGRFNKDGETNGMQYDVLRRSLMGACVSAGIFNPAERVRGRGAWAGPEGQLVLHRGNSVLFGNTWHKPGMIGPHLYLADEALPRPVAEPQGKLPAESILEMLGTWNFRRGDLDQRLLLGWIGAAMLGGALSWRPTVWVTGAKGSGKSTLHRALSGVMGGALIAVADATAAGIWQRLGNASLPVIVDELEAGENLNAQGGIIRFARLAASGGQMARGTTDHTGVQFAARSCFLFSSILIPSLTPQDQSRIVVLQLGDLTSNNPPSLEEARLKEFGALLLRRLVDAWERYPQALDAYRFALMREGSSSRSADVLGTLLACADLLTSDYAVDSDSAQEAAMALASLADHAEESDRDETQCLSHLLTTSVPLGTPDRKPVGEWVATAFDRASTESDYAITVLSRYGMKVLSTSDGGRFLAVANSHDGLRRLFDSTPWAARSGAPGVWIQALRRLPGAIKPKNDGKVRIERNRDMRPTRVTLVPLAHILNPETLDRPSSLPVDTDG